MIADSKSETDEEHENDNNDINDTSNDAMDTSDAEKENVAPLLPELPMLTKQNDPKEFANENELVSLMDCEIPHTAELPVPLHPIQTRPTPLLLPICDLMLFEVPKKYAPAKKSTVASRIILNRLNALENQASALNCANAPIEEINAKMGESNESFGRLVYSDSE